MKSSRHSILLVALAVIVSLGSLLKVVADARSSSAQAPGQSLNIARHADEPFGIVDIKVGDRSLRKNISVKYRNGDENSVVIASDDSILDRRTDFVTLTDIIISSVTESLPPPALCPAGSPLPRRPFI
jgi:hypothetical protein